MSKLMKLRKAMDKRNIITEMNDPTHWISTGNSTLNYRLTGDINKGISNRRTFLLWGPSGSGKSFLASTAAKNAQDDGYVVVYIDSENSVSYDYMEKIGIDLSPEMFVPIDVGTIEEGTAVISDIFDTFDKDDKFIIIFDSLAGLLTEKEEDEFNKGTSKGDMGQFSKKLKLLVKNINRKISEYDAFCVMVTHAYQNQDLLNGEGKWICTGGKGFQFFPSFAVKLEPAALKEGKEAVAGVRIKCEVNKTRFTSPRGKCQLHVPYDKGIDFTDGLLEVLEEEGTVRRTGGWYQYDLDGEVVKFQRSKLEDHVDALIKINKMQKSELVETHNEEDEPEE